MNLEKFGNALDELSKSEKEMFKDFLLEDAQAPAEPVAPAIATSSTGVEARAKDLELDQIVEITQELSDGTIKKFKFKIIEIWPAPTNFFTVVSLSKPKDELNFWTLFYDNTWYIKKGNKSLINVHVKLV
jgi:hypothetical protein